MPTLDFKGQKIGFDITIPAYEYKTWRDLFRKLRGWCKKFTFQLEKGASGYKHWQCRVSLIKKRTAAAILSEVAPTIGGNWTLTSDSVHNGPKHFNYVMKEDTRIDGPWTDETPCGDPPVMTRQLREFYNKVAKTGYYPWQEFIRDRAKVLDDRIIVLVYDPKGHSGKSRLIESLEYEELAMYVPPMDTQEKMSQFLFGYETRACYCIDLPRGMKKDKKRLWSMYAGIEMLKDGRVYDMRYSGRKRSFDSPQVFVFSNGLPDFDLLSNDRWLIVEIQEDNSYILREPSYYNCRDKEEIGKPDKVGSYQRLV